MSYDLFFTKPEITLEQFLVYFKDRKNYKINNCQACYENEDTGVYFCFDYSDEPSKDPEGPEGRVSFNLNFNRPHFFSLEAEPEVNAFVKHFGFSIFDSQSNTQAESVYSTDEFLRGWNYGNEAAISKIGRLNEYTLPTNELESIWRWNMTRTQIQSKVGENVFVPKITFFKIDAKLQSAVVWTDAIPTLIPKVNALIILRQRLAPRRLFKKQQDICVVPFDNAISILEPFKTNDYITTAFSLPYPMPPANVVNYVKNLNPHKGQMEGVLMDKILNREIVEKYKKVK